MSGERARLGLPVRTDRFAWFAFAALGIAILLLAVASATSYTDIVIAQTGVSVVPRYAIAYRDTNPDGSLSSNSTITASVSLTVENPSSRTVRLRFVAYSGWMEDAPVEAGLNESRRRTDDILVTDSGTRYFARIFGEAADIEPLPVPPSGNVTFTFSYNVSRPDDPTTFDAAWNITGYAIATSGNLGGIVWNHWVLVRLSIDGVPQGDSPSAPLYLRTIGLIDRQVGLNLA